jgi:hypothetical protein
MVLPNQVTKWKLLSMRPKDPIFIVIGWAHQTRNNLHSITQGTTRHGTMNNTSLVIHQ